MYTYKVGGMLITDELYHDDLDAMTFGRRDQNELYHYGILGQKWGIRRYQNPDGTLTDAGKKRYGNYELGKHYLENNKPIRRLATGDHPLTSKRFYDKKEIRLEKRISKLRERGKTVSQGLLRKYNGIKINNIERDISNSYVGTGKVFAQRILLGSKRGKYYREARAQGYGRIKSLRRANAEKRLTRYI